MRCKVRDVLFTETVLFARMSEQTPLRVGQTLKIIESAIEARKQGELENRNGSLSKDFGQVEAYRDDKTVAAFALATGVNLETYLNSIAYSDAEFEKKSKVPAEAKTRNLKAYKKFRETAHYFAHNGKLEAVIKTFVACALMSSKYHVEIPRDVCTRFLDSIPLSHVSDELREVLDHYRAEHMSGGAPTQTSQCTLTLANMRAAKVVQNGRFKDFALDLDSPVIESFAERFGMVEVLEKAREYRATVQTA